MSFKKRDLAALARPPVRLILLLLFSALLSSSVSAQSLTIAAAADLAPLEPALRQALPALNLRFTFGSSGMLAHQIENGAPYDLFLSATQGFVRDLARAGRLLPDTVRPYATGRLGLWSAGGGVRKLDDLLRPEVRHVAIANPRHAPYGLAAEQMLRKLGLWDKLQDKLVLGENVRQAFEFARTGNADAVITSWTLLVDKGGVLLPDTGHAPIRQSGGVVRGAANERAARAFLDFLAGPEGQRLLGRFGLFPPAR